MTNLFSWLAGVAGYGAIAFALALVLVARFVPGITWSALAMTIAFAVLGATFVAQREVTSSLRTELTDTRRQHAQTLGEIASKTADAYKALNQMRDAQATAFAEMDARHTKELIDAKVENDRLRAGARARSVVVRIPGASCPADPDPVPETASAGGLGHAAAEADAALRERVFDLREALISAETQVEYLQGYARRCSAQEAAP